MRGEERQPERRVVVLAPEGDNAARCRAALSGEGIGCDVLADISGLTDELARGAGALVVDERALCAGGAHRFADMLGCQPEWSNLPIVLLSRNGRASPAARRAARLLRNVSALRWPAPSEMLLALLRAVLGAGQQQRGRDGSAEREPLEPMLSAGEREREAVGARDGGGPDLLADALPSQVWTATADGRLDYLNRRVEEYFGRPAASILAGERSGPVHPDDLPHAEEHWWSAVERGEAFRDEVRLRRADGSYRWHLVTAQPRRDGTGRVVKWFGVNTDIEEQRRAEAALFESERFAGTIASSISEGVIVYDRELRYIGWNCFMERLTGVRAEQVLGRKALSMFPRLRARGIGKLIERALAGEVVRSADTPVEHARTGERAWFVGHYAPHIGSGGRTLGVVAIIHDVTERKRAEEAALRLEREQAARAEAEAARAAVTQTLESITDAFYALDDGWRFTYVNGEAERLLGRSREELLGRSVWERFPEARRWPIHDALKRAAAEHTSVTVEYLHPSLDAWFHVRAYPSRGGGLSVYFRDITRRKRAEDALRESERRQAFALDAAELGAWELDLKTYKARRTPRHDEIFGYRPMLDDWTYGRFMEHVHPEDRERVDHAFRRSIEAGVGWEFECRITRADEERRWVWARGSVERDEGGEPARMRGLVQDITARKRVDEALRESERRLAAIFDQVAAGIAQRDLTGRFTRVNERFCEMVGRPAEELLKMRMQQITHPDDLPENAALFERLVKEGRNFAIEKRYVRPDGTIVWVRTSVCALRDDRGTPYAVVAVCLDITARKAAEAARVRAMERQSRQAEQLQALAKASLEINEAEHLREKLELTTAWARRIIGAHQSVTSTTEGSDWSRPVTAVSLSEKYAAYRDHGEAPRSGGLCALVCERNEPMRLTQEQVRSHPAWRGPDAAGGARPPLRGWLAAPLVGWDGRNLGLVQLSDKAEGDFTAEDESILVQLAQHASAAIEQAGAEERLLKLNETLEQRVAERTAMAEQRAAQLQALASELTRAEQRERRRIAQVLHDHLQQLLVGAQMHLGVLRNEAAGRARESLGQVSELLRESIAVSRSLTVELSPPVLYDAGLVAALEWLRRQMAKKQGLSVEVEADPTAEPATDDLRAFCFQAVRELLFNVSKHAKTDRAAVRLSDDGSGRARIVVADEGVGFDAAVADEPDASGVRFGLFSIRERLEMLGGRLEVDSAPGRGTRVTVVAPRRLPAPGIAADGTEAPAGPAPDAAPVAEGGGGAAAPPDKGAAVIRVLLADDHDIVRQGLIALLAPEPDIEVVGEASDGEMALEVARRLRPDVVVMDVTMPRLTGIETTRRLARELPRVRVIGLSMHERENMASAMRDAGAVAYLTKGGPSEPLIAAIRGKAVARGPGGS